MIGTECLFDDRQRPLVERFGVSVTTLFAIEFSEVAQRSRDIAMIGAERFFADCTDLL